MLMIEVSWGYPFNAHPHFGRSIQNHKTRKRVLDEGQSMLFFIRKKTFAGKPNSDFTEQTIRYHRDGTV